MLRIIWLMHVYTDRPEGGICVASSGGKFPSRRIVPTGRKNRQKEHYNAHVKAISFIYRHKRMFSQHDKIRNGMMGETERLKKITMKVSSFYHSRLDIFDVHKLKTLNCVA